MIPCTTSPIRPFYLSCTPFCVWKTGDKMSLGSAQNHKKGDRFFRKTVEGLRALSKQIENHRFSLAVMTKGEVVFLKQQIEHQYKKAEKEHHEALQRSSRLMRFVQRVIDAVALFFHLRPDEQKIYQTLIQCLDQNIYARIGKVFALDVLHDISREQLVHQITERKLRILALLHSTGHLGSDPIDENGDSLLHLAARIGDIAYIHCSPISLSKNQEGKDPIDLALEEANYSVLTAFLNRGYTLTDQQKEVVLKKGQKGSSWLVHCLKNNAAKGIEYLTSLKKESISDCLVESCMSGYSSALYTMLCSSQLSPHISTFSFAKKFDHTLNTPIHQFCQALGKKGYLETADLHALYAIAKHQSKGKTNLSSTDAKNYLKADPESGDNLLDANGKFPTDYLPEGFDHTWKGYFLAFLQ